MSNVKKCQFIIDKNGNRWLPPGTSMSAMWSRSVWFRRLSGKRGLIASQAHWESLRKDYDTFEIMENEDGSHKTRRVAGCSA